MTDHEDDRERTLRLRHLDLDSYVDVRLRPYDGDTWIARADLGDDRDVGIDKEPRKAIAKALGSLGERCAREMAESAKLEGEE